MSDGPSPIHKLPQRLGRYTLTKRLGIGGMAEVFLAQQDGPAGFQKACVVKRILPHLALEPRMVEMFQREARVAAMLQHTNVVHIYELGEADGAFFIAMEYVDGAPLHHLARASWRSGRPLPMELVCCALSDAALGLAAAHDLRDASGAPLRLIHRDISPDNLMINREGVTKILDFGVAKTAHGERTATGELKGKLPFLSPEQIRGDTIDHRVDIYALGVTAYWLLTGRRPFVAPTDLALMHTILSGEPRPLRELNSTVPEGLEQLVLQMLDKDADKRPPNGSVIADALGAAILGRRSVVAPFVRDMLDGGGVEAREDSGPAPPSFLSATPTSGEMRIVWQRARAQPLATAAPAVRKDVVDFTANAIAMPVPAETEPSTVPVLRRAPMQAGDSAPTSPGPLDEHDAPPGGTPSRATAALLGVALALAVAGVAALVMRRAPIASVDAGARAALVVDAGARRADLAVADAGARTALIVDGGAAPTSTIDAGEVTADDDPAGDPHAPRRAPRDVVVTAPSSVKWMSERGKLLGQGNATLHLPAGTRRIFAVESMRGGRVGVPVGAGPIAYASLPHGKIQVRANPYAEVTLGKEMLGTTPFAPIDVVAGSYKLRFRYQGREETRAVDVVAGDTVRVAVDFGG